jgi:hypothetical protein
MSLEYEIINIEKHDDNEKFDLTIRTFEPEFVFNFSNVILRENEDDSTYIDCDFSVLQRDDISMELHRVGIDQDINEFGELLIKKVIDDILENSLPE